METRKDAEKRKLNESLRFSNLLEKEANEAKKKQEELDAQQKDTETQMTSE